MREWGIAGDSEKPTGSRSAPLQNDLARIEAAQKAEEPSFELLIIEPPPQQKVVVRSSQTIRQVLIEAAPKLGVLPANADKLVLNFSDVSQSLSAPRG